MDRYYLLKLREQGVSHAMVQLVQVVDELFSADLTGFGAAVYSVVALGVFAVQRLHFGLLVALRLQERIRMILDRWVNRTRQPDRIIWRIIM